MTQTPAAPAAEAARPVVRAAARLAAVPAGWPLAWRLAVALAAGALLALAHAPFSLWPLIFPCLTLLVWLLDSAAGRWRRCLLLLAFLWGYFAAGLYWVGIAFFVDAERFAMLLPLPVLGLPLLLAAVMLLPALPFLWHWPAGVRRILLLALALAAGDYLRSFLFTGFPWNLFGYVWLGGEPVLQSAGWIGIHGLGLLTVALGAMPAMLADPAAARPRGGPAVWLGGGLAVFAVLAALGSWRLAAAGAPALTDLNLRIVQPNVPQTEKWRPPGRERHFLRSIELSRRQAAEGPAPELTIWPETAVPYYLANDPQRRQQIAAAVPPGGWLVTGAPRFERPAGGAARPTVWNSLQVVGAGGGIAANYDKRHLVPFGEFLPLRGLLGLVGLDNLAQSGTDFSSGTGPGLLQVAGVPPFRALICYEGIFPAEIAEGRGPAQWLLNITNDAWFGDSSGPYQHFGMTRVRAIEQGLPLVRAANTGISAIVDPYGRVLARLGLGETGVIDGRLPAALPQPPPYARFGDLLSLLPVLALGLLVAAAAPAAGRRPQPGPGPGENNGRNSSLAQR